MDTKKGTVAIIGGGAAGMACAVMLARRGRRVALIERGDRLGRKLSASGNGQGNVTNVRMGAEHYFTDDSAKLARILAAFGPKDAIAFLESMGGVFLPDSRGRVYPASRQASAVTDLFRRELSRLGAEVCLGAQVTSLAYDPRAGKFILEWAGGQMYAEAVVLAAGGKAAPVFGTDGAAYALAQSFSHTLTPLSPALVQLKTEPSAVRGLKGIRLDALVTVRRGDSDLVVVRGDVLFTESGVSGDAVFRASSYARAGDELVVDLAPEVPFSRLAGIRRAEELLCILPNGLARALERRAGGGELGALAKRFRLVVTGTAGFQAAQVTKGGVPLAETDDALMSNFRSGLYFAGEILNVDGECGGYNLHWAFASAHAVAEALS